MDTELLLVFHVLVKNHYVIVILYLRKSIIETTFYSYFLLIMRLFDLISNEIVKV